MSVIEAKNPVQINRLADALDANRWDGVFDSIKPIISQAVQSNFATHSGPTLTGSVSIWPPRKDTNLHPLLIESGAMLAAAAWNGSGAIRIINADSITWGVDRTIHPQARAQQFGHTYHVRGRTWRLPPRPFLGLRDEFEDRIKLELQGEVGYRMGAILA